MSGFPELLPEQQIVFNRCLDIIRRNFELLGFAPIETPAVERKEVLTSKGGEEKEIYALSRLVAGEGESPETEFALHFDLTVPLARYVAQHKEKLVFPFRRYQIQKVWRGERPQKGRYRELYQCDIDVIGRGSVGLLNDAEIPSVIYRIFTELAIGDLSSASTTAACCRAFTNISACASSTSPACCASVDKLEKIGRDKVHCRAQRPKSVCRTRCAARFCDFVANSTGRMDELLGALSDLRRHAQTRCSRKASTN